MRITTNFNEARKISKLVDKEVEEFMLDCFGHTLLYLMDPKAKNECKNAINFIHQWGIYYD